MSDFKTSLWDWAEVLADWAFLMCVFALCVFCLKWAGVVG